MSSANGTKLDIDVTDAKVWEVKNPRNPKEEWTEREKLCMDLNRYIFVQMLCVFREIYVKEFPGFNKLYENILFALFAPAGPGRATGELCKRIIKPLLENRSKLQTRNPEFLHTDFFPQFFKTRIDAKQLWKYIVDGDREAKASMPADEYVSEVDVIWDHVDKVWTRVFALIQQDPELTLQPIPEKERMKILSKPENSDVLKAVTDYARKKKRLNPPKPNPEPPTSTAAATDSVSGLGSRSANPNPPQVSNPNPNPNTNTNPNTNPNTKHRSNPISSSKYQRRPTLQRDEKGDRNNDDDDDDDNDDDDDDDDEGDDEANANTNKIFEVIGDMMKSDSVQELMRMGQAEDAAAAAERKGENGTGGSSGGDGGKPLSEEERKASDESRKSRMKGIISGFADGIFKLTSAVGSKDHKISESEREQKVSRFEHVLSKVTDLDIAIHPNPDHLIEDAQNEALEERTLKDHETLQRCDIMTHFHEEALSFVYMIYTTRATEGAQKYHEFCQKYDECKAANDVKQMNECGKSMEIYEPFNQLYLHCESFFETVTANPQTSIYLDELVKLHQCKPLRKFLKKKNPILFLHPCARKDATTDDNQYFKLLWSISPAIAQLLYTVRVDRLFATYQKYKKNVQLIWNRIGKLLQFVGILKHFQDGTSMSALRPVLISILAMNRVTPEKQSDPNYISRVLEGVISKFGTQRNVAAMKQTCSDILSSNDINRPMSIFREMLTPDMADSLGLDDDSDDEIELKKGTATSAPAMAVSEKNRAMERLQTMMNTVLSGGGKSANPNAPTDADGGGNESAAGESATTTKTGHKLFDNFFASMKKNKAESSVTTVNGGLGMDAVRGRGSGTGSGTERDPAAAASANVRSHETTAASSNNSSNISSSIQKKSGIQPKSKATTTTTITTTTAGKKQTKGDAVFASDLVVEDLETPPTASELNAKMKVVKPAHAVVTATSSSDVASTTVVKSKTKTTTTNVAHRSKLVPTTTTPSEQNDEEEEVVVQVRPTPTTSHLKSGVKTSTKKKSAATAAPTTAPAATAVARKSKSTISKK